MRYCASDLHGEYELFVRLLDKIGFGEGDQMYLCGDIIDKGPSSLRLAKFIAERSNIHSILGNHEQAFLDFYHSLLESGCDSETMLARLREYFPSDRGLLDWELVDWIESLPTYIETDEFICVHAGIPISPEGELLLSDASVNQLVHDRRFKNPDATHRSPKCVFFGHTQTDCIIGEPKIIGHRRTPFAPTDTLEGFSKIHLDTGTWSNGVMACLCIDTCKAYYVRR